MHDHLEPTALPPKQQREIHQQKQGKNQTSIRKNKGNIYTEYKRVNKYIKLKKMA